MDEPQGGAAALPPVLYLDVDDTLINWANYQAKPARGVREFLAWAMDRFEVRWLTRRCPGGEMPDGLVGELSGMMEVDPARFASIRGLSWETCDSKVNGIAWLEHLVLGRPWVWVEDENGAGEWELALLEEHGCRDAHFHVNVSYHPESLRRAHERLQGWLADGDRAPDRAPAPTDPDASAR